MRFAASFDFGLEAVARRFRSDFQATNSGSMAAVRTKRAFAAATQMTAMTSGLATSFDIIEARHRIGVRIGVSD